MKSKIFALVLLATLPFSLLAQSNPTEDATAVFERFLTSFTNADFEGVIELFSSDAMFWGTGSKTLVEQNAGIRQYFSRLNSQEPGTTIARALDYSVFEISESSVLVSGMWEILPAGETVAVPLRVSMALSLRNGEWKIIQFHNSQVPE